ncbi:MAG: hypothetical protein GY869_01175 [Planctomycetes bacterium]|nr:hypothetical protein [Planctomycetota bacterium]
MKHLIIAVLTLCALLCFTGCRSSPPAHEPADQTQQIGHKESGIPDGIDPKQTSDDPTYGYTKDNPIKVGGPEGFSGPSSEQLYLRHLRDSKFRPMSFVRIGSFGPGPDGNILDGYMLADQDGNKFTLYIDMYHKDVHPFRVKAPKGMYFWK